MINYCTSNNPPSLNKWTRAPRQTMYELSQAEISYTWDDWLFAHISAYRTETLAATYHCVGPDLQVSLSDTYIGHFRKYFKYIYSYPTPTREYE